MTKPPCRCLLSAMPDEAALAALVRERIAEIPEEERAGEADYSRRLGACKQCRWLNRGTCAQCGCYVEIRAARSGMGCPDVPPRW